MTRRTASANHMAGAMNHQEPQQSHRHLEDMTNRRQVSQMQPQAPHSSSIHHDTNGRSKENKLIIDVDVKNLDPVSVVFIIQWH